MTKHPFAVSVCIALLAIGSVAHGQRPSPSSAGGYSVARWSDASSSSLAAKPATEQGAGAYRARFQTQGGLAGLPTLPDSPTLNPTNPVAPDLPATPAVLPQDGLPGMQSSRLSDADVIGVNLSDGPDYLAPSQPVNTMSPTPPPFSQAPPSAPANEPAKGTSMPMLGGSQFRPSPESSQLTSGADLASSELRVRQQRSSSQVLPRNVPDTTPSPLNNQPRIPVQAVTTGQPFVSPGRPRGRYATRPINPAFYQLAAFQRDASGGNVAIGTYPAGARTPVQPPRQNHPADQMAAYQAQSNTNTPARFTSNATPMPATSLAAQQRAYENPGIYQTAFTQQCNGPGFPSNGMPAPGVNGTYPPPTLTPGAVPGMYAPSNAGYRPLFTLGQENFNVALGRGIIGQPTVYVAGQPVRNFLRYLSP